MPSATVRNLEASLEEISNDDTLNTNNDNLYVLANDGVITLESVSNSNSMSQEDSMDSFAGSVHSLMMKGIFYTSFNPAFFFFFNVFIKIFTVILYR
jgi:hypothetical protein